MDPIYAPETDGGPDPGEVVWAWVPYEEDASRSHDHDLDAEQEASEGRYWMDIGSGAWDTRGRPSEVRLNRLLRLDPSTIRREGAALDPQVFAAVVDAAASYLPPASGDAAGDVAGRS